MEKNILIVLASFILLSGCGLKLKGTTATVKYLGKDTNVYVFDTKAEVRASFKSIVKNETGTVYGTKVIGLMQEQFDEAEFKYDEEDYKKFPDSYPDFSEVDGNYIAIWSTKRHDLSTVVGVTQYYETYAINVYEYDDKNEICSKFVTIDTGLKIKMKL